MAITVAMMIGSARASAELVKTSITSIQKNIGTNALFCIGISPQVEESIIQCVKDRMQGLSYKIWWNFAGTWAEFMNQAIQEAEGEWFLVTHDDVALISKGVIPTIEKSLQGFLEKTGWITLTDNDYLNGHWAPCVREGWHIDAIHEKGWDLKKLHHFHKLPTGWFKPENTPDYFLNLDYDFPVRPVKCHSPYSHFNLIRLSVLKEIGWCENWSKISLLVDEDWGLEALRHGYFNVWMPSLIYTHRRLVNGTRAFRYSTKEEQKKGEAERMQCHALFKKKWGFDPEVLPHNLQEMQKRYAGTNLFWSLDKRSYEWDYV